MNVSKELAQKVLAVVDAGLVKGIGEPVPGKMCVEAAVNYALGAPHGDDPACVGRAVRAFKIRLNDAGWPSNAARTRGMRKLAIAQLGSNEIDQVAFARYVALHTIKRILPVVLRKVGLSVEALACENAVDLPAAAARADAAAPATARAAAPYAAADAAARAAAAAAAAAARADATAARADAADAAADAAAAAAYAAAAAARAAYYAADAADAADAAAHEILLLSAQIGLEALQVQNSPGCQWLDLCE